MQRFGLQVTITFLGSSEFVAASLKHAGEFYERRVRMQSAGIDLSALNAAVYRCLNIEDKGLSCPKKHPTIARARALISYVATQNLSISGSKVARRFNVDRPAISRWTERLSRDPELLSATKSIQGALDFEINQR